MNKIGTCEIARLAKQHNVPFYVAAPLASVNIHMATGEHFIIEESGVRISAYETKCWNPNFDVTPACLITGIITEYGVYGPKSLKEEIKRINNKSS